MYHLAQTMQINKPVIRTALLLLFILLLETILLGYFVFKQDSPQDALTSAYVITPIIIVINFIIALLLFLIKRQGMTWLLLLNCLFTPIIYNQLEKAFYFQYEKTHFDTYYFAYKHRFFEIRLEPALQFYSFTDITNQRNGSTFAFIGDYKVKNDSILLIDSNRRPVIFKNALYGYPTPKDKIQLKRDIMKF